MYFIDHNPPHYKAKYSEFEANILISNGTILNGDLPVSKLKLVSAWAEIKGLDGKLQPCEFDISAEFAYYNSVQV